MEQHRIAKRLMELDVAMLLSQTLAGASSEAARLACVYTEREQELACDAIVLVTARLPRDSIAADLEARREQWDSAGLRSVRAIGDASAPSTIAAAVWDGHRYAEELDRPDAGDDVRFRREIVELSQA
jgi:dimethylamine/trimethylamine dehydrogenase